jgi:hypothetical protein
MHKQPRPRPLSGAQPGCCSHNTATWLLHKAGLGPSGMNREAGYGHSFPTFLDTPGQLMLVSSFFPNKFLKGPWTRIQGWCLHPLFTCSTRSKFNVIQVRPRCFHSPIWKLSKRTQVYSGLHLSYFLLNLKTEGSQGAVI